MTRREQSQVNDHLPPDSEYNEVISAIFEYYTAKKNRDTDRREFSHTHGKTRDRLTSIPANWNLVTFNLTL